MDFTAPVSTLMTRKLITVSTGDNLTTVRDIFNSKRIHHIPVVRYTTLVGIISEADFLPFLKGIASTKPGQPEYDANLESILVEDIMTTGIATLESTDRINVALQLFSENIFHAIPIVDNGELVGMLTTFDIIKKLQEDDTARIKSV